MATFVYSFSSRHVLCIDHDQFLTIGHLKQHLTSENGIEANSCFLICNGNIVDDSDPVRKDVVYHTYLRLPGGKGGFGSMLRAIGAQIEKTTNHEACRDLSGRRMRDINNEKDLKEWLGKQSEREREREQRRQDRLARRRAMPNHKFSDPLYDEQKALLAEMQEDALQTGLKKAFAKPGSSSTITSEEQGSCKRKSEMDGPSCSGVNKNKKKKATEWLGMDIENLSDLDSDDDDISDNKTSTAEETNTYSEDSNSAPSVDCMDTTDIKADIMIDNTDKIGDHSESNNHVSDSGNIASETKNGKDAIETAIKTEVNETDVQETLPFNLDEAKCMEEVEKLGLDRLKQELMDRGLKCGGTLEQRAERLYSVKGLSKDQIDPALFAKSNGKKVKNRK